MVAETRILAAAFPSASDAQAAVQDLRQHGFPERDISLVYTDAGHTIGEGLLNGAVWGGVLGALFGLLFPPVGLLVAAGPIAGVLASGATLGAAGALTVGGLNGVVSALVQLGLPEEMATGLGEHVRKGDTLVLAHADSAQTANQARQLLETHHPRAETAPSGVVTATPARS